MSSSNRTLKLIAAAYSPEDGRLRYRFDADGKTVEYTASAINNAGIRGVEFPEPFDAFLREYLSVDGLVVRRLVRVSLEAIDGASSPITWPGTSKNLHLVCNGCTRIEAPTTWRPALLGFEPQARGGMVLFDAAANFTVTCQQIRVLENVEPRYRTTAA